MQSRIVLISDDSNYFDYIKLKLELRTSDEILTLSFDEVPEKMDLLKSSVLIVNSENSYQKTIGLLNIFNYSTPIIVTAYNDDDVFKKKCYRAGMLDFIPLLTSNAEFRARMLPALNLVSILQKNEQYRTILVKNKILSKNNEVFINYEQIIDNALSALRQNPSNAVFAAIAPDDRNKYLLNPNYIETFLVNNVRKNDIIMKFAHNKYYLIMYNTDLASVQKHWSKAAKKFHHKIYAGFVNIKKQSRQQLINTALINLQEAYRSDGCVHSEVASGKNKGNDNCVNFKMHRKDLAQRLEVIISPVLYRMQQKYMNKFSGVKIEQSYNNGNGEFNIIGKHFSALFTISCPGFIKVNINIKILKDSTEDNIKRISFEPDEFDEGLLEDLIVQFANEIKSYCCA